MNASFLLVTTAALIFKGLSSHVNCSKKKSLNLLGKADFFGGAQAQRLLLDLLACVSILVGFWGFPPAFLKGAELDFIRYAGTSAVFGGFLVDAALFLRMRRAQASAEKALQMNPPKESERD